jgi:hypothetical protein
MKPLRLTALLLLAAASTASAAEFADGRLLVNGFGAAGYGRTDGNALGEHAVEGGSYENTTFGLTLTANTTERTVVAGQFFSHGEEGVEVDWIFGEYRASDLLRFRVGQIKTPLGIYQEIQDVGTLRPFFTLPASVYGASGVGFEAFKGAAVAGNWRLPARWSIGYDVFGGEFHSERFEPYNALVPAEHTDPLTGEIEIEEEETTKDFMGARLVLGTPVEGLDFRLSGYSGKPAEESGRHAVYGFSANYEGDRVWARGEVFRSSEDEARSWSGYAELASFVVGGLQVAGRVDLMRTSLEDFDDPSPLLRHRELALGVNYWFTRDFVVKLSVHDVFGNRFTSAGEDAEGEADERTRMVVFGSQFSF